MTNFVTLGRRKTNAYTIKNINMKANKLSKPAAIALALPLAFGVAPVALSHPAAAAAVGVAARAAVQSGAVVDVSLVNPTTVRIRLADNKEATMDFYGENIFRYFRDDAGGGLRDPKSNPPAQILVNNPRKKAEVSVKHEGNTYFIATSKIRVELNAQNGADESG